MDYSSKGTFNISLHVLNILENQSQDCIPEGTDINQIKPLVANFLVGFFEVTGTPDSCEDNFRNFVLNSESIKDNEIFWEFMKGVIPKLLVIEAHFSEDPTLAERMTDHLMLFGEYLAKRRAPLSRAYFEKEHFWSYPTEIHAVVV